MTIRNSQTLLFFELGLSQGVEKISSKACFIISVSTDQLHSSTLGQLWELKLTHRNNLKDLPKNNSIQLHSKEGSMAPKG